jgi:diguanylate cyclase (GGDEF)-like protein
MTEFGLSKADNIVKCLGDITRHRDVSLLNVSVMKALMELLDLEHISLYDIFERNNQLFVALCAWDENGQIHYFEDSPAEDHMEEIGRHPEIARHFERGDTAANATLGGDDIYCVPVTLEDHVTPDQFAMVNGIVNVYRNYLSLLKDSQHDTLTGLLNRKTFDHGLADLLPVRVEQEVRTHFSRNARSAIQADTHWFAIIDIDNFKRINDQYGHIFGDEVLILLANLMRKTFRNRDRLYRFGGEEFVALIRNVDFDNAYQKLEAFRNTVASYKFPQIDQLTVTIGFAQARATDTPEMVVGNADEALYFGKAHGRNQVNCYGTLMMGCGGAGQGCGLVGGGLECAIPK